MATQYSYSEAYLTPESEFRAEELKKRMMSEMANFAQIRFKRSMQLMMSILEDNK